MQQRATLMPKGREGTQMALEGMWTRSEGP